MTHASFRKLPRTLLIIAMALAGTLATFALPVAAVQAAERSTYAVTLAKPLEAPQREIISGAMWRCEGDRCSAPARGERAAALCGKVARAFGEVARFEGPQGELDAGALAKCNADVVSR